MLATTISIIYLLITKLFIVLHIVQLLKSLSKHIINSFKKIIAINKLSIKTVSIRRFLQKQHASWAIQKDF
jgi:hypothetical protein